MADLSDVENAIVAKVLSVLYPNGVSQASVVGVTCRVYRGWPSPAGLNSDLAGGTVNVTIFPATVLDDVPDPYFDRLYVNISPTSLTATVTGSNVALSGPVVSNQIVGLLIDGVPFAYGVKENDTTASIAASLTALICAKRIAIVAGSTITIPGVISLFPRVVTNGTVSRGLRRQRRDIQVICWCPSPALRDSVCKSVDLALAASSFIELSDDTKAHVRYVSTKVYDQSQTALLYRRDLCYKFEYTMIDISIAPVMLFGDLVNNGRGSFL